MEAPGGILVDVQVRVVDVGVDLPGERCAKHRRQAEVGAADAPFVVERCLVRRDDAAAAANEVGELAALRLRQGSDVRQDECPVTANVRSVEQLVVHHVERDARLDQRMVEAQRVILDPGLRAVATVAGRGLLRVHHRHARQRLLVAEIPLVAPVPDVDVLDGFHPACVHDLAVELGEPWPEIVGDAVDGPQPYLFAVLHRVLPAVGLLDAHAEDAADGLAAHAWPCTPCRSSRSTRAA